MPKVSVIIPAYNAMTYLPDTLKSALQQTFIDFEVLIVDDGSSDNIVQWANGLTDERVKFISQSHQGVSTARNLAISKASGDYITFLDADDLWKRTKIERQAQFLDDNPTVGLVATWMMLTDEQGNPGAEVKIDFKQGNIRKKLIEISLIPCGSIPMVRRACFDKVGLFDPTLRFGEDWEMWTRIAADYDFGLIEETLVYYRQHSKNSSKNSQEILPDFDRLIEKMFDFVPQEVLAIRAKTYGRMNLYIAWKSLENEDYRGARDFSNQAIKYYPQLQYTKNYLRLKLLTLVKSKVNKEIYHKLTRFVRQRQKVLVNK
ncbi:glycosyltransferase family 2 protein [Chlorogloea sp. CCALA 695]|uniref:glycosyltransferase family 2 protein n=1 Tax=Chlorogloea sp. CCALA 695 TaxID=2107693 RepID=UPI000D06DB12|nr:glycosyltransferase family A protein [Chlorogloea sp. CCALA 695]PSB33839.1 glycosyl transferase family A [Chlorogloea sp. CCALA 695]